MTEVISVRFRGGCKNYDFAPKGLTVKMGEEVVVETAQGLEFATCTVGNHEVEDSAVVQPLCPVLRHATDADRAAVERNRRKESEAFDICEKKIADHGLEMKLVNVSCSFDGAKIIFFFTADGRVDFRELVRDLASVFRARIELRQIGVRDEAKMVGGLGICGRPFCCSQFLDSFLPVSIKMAKTQNLSLNPTKISGTCGRLMCCLKYEQEAYEDLVRRAPKQESFVETPDGAGTVSGVNLLRQTCQVRLESDPDSPKCYHNCELCVVRSGKGKRPEGYVQPPLSELAKLRRQEETDAPTPEDSLSAALAAYESRVPGEQSAPAPVPDQGEGERRRRRRRSGRSHGEGRPPEGESRQSEGARPPRPPRPPKPEQEGERPPRPEGEGEHRPRRRRRRGGGGRRPEGAGGQE